MKLTLKSFFLFVATVLQAGNVASVYGQVPTVQDCNGAIPVCQSIYFQPNSFSGTGNYPGEINPFISCLGGEINSVWYTFTVQTAGSLCFSITPNSPADDYDWALYNLTNANCADIATNAALQVRCNFDVGGGPPGGVTGATGLAGAGQAPCLNVIPGQTYTLNISNFSASQFGYTLQFTGSAVIFDNIPPSIKPFAPITACGADSLVITFSENVLCSTVSTDDFVLTDPNGNNVPFLGISGAVCSSGGNQENVYTLRLAGILSVQGIYTFSMVGTAGFVFDLCGNGTTAASFSIPVSFPPVSAGTGTFVNLCTTDAPFNLATLLTGTPTAGGVWKEVGTNALVSSTFTPGISSSGQYRYVVGTSPCPTDSAIVTIQVFDPPQAGTGTTVAVCSSEPPFGLFSLLTNADPGGFWINPAGNPFGGAFTPGADPAGTYVYQINGQGTCLADTAQVQVQVRPKPVFGLSISPLSCGANFIADVTVNPTAPGGPYTVELIGIGANLPLTIPGGLSSGNYTLVVAAGNGCTDTLNFSVTSPPPVTLQLDSLRNPGCALPTGGGIFTQATGGTAPFQYYLNGFGPVNSGTFTGLTAGGYEVVVEDGSGCRDTIQTTLVVPTSVSVSVQSFVEPSCQGNSDGSIVLTASGGVGPYAFSINGFNFFANPTFSGLPADTMTIYTVDNLGCLGQDTFVLNEPPLLGLVINASANPDCAGNQNGSFTLNGSGGTAPFQFSIDGVNYQSAPVFSGLPAGVYTLSVTDVNGCSFSAIDTLTSPTGLSALLGSVQGPTCAGSSNGGFIAQAFGGAGGYTYSINGINFFPSGTFSAIPAGNYTLSIRDAANCLITLPVNLNQPSGFALQVSGLLPVTCQGANDGAFTLSATGSVGPFQYSIDGGVTFQNTGVFTGLDGGTYPAVVEDGNGCTALLSVVVSEPNGLNVFVNNLVPAACFGSFTGSFRLEAIGGTQPYSFSVNNSPFSSNFQYSNLGSGNFQAVVIDGNGCTDTLNLSVTQPLPLVVTAQVTDVACFGDSSGSFTLQAQGGSPAYFYQSGAGNFLNDSVASSLAAGNYLVIGTDNKGCTDTLTVVVSQPAPLVGGVQNLTPVSCFQLQDGELELTATGGNPGYLFAFIGNAFGPDSVFQNLGAGSYTWVILDSRGCLDTLIATMTQPLPLSLVVDSLSNPKCAGGADGEVVLLATGGNVPFQYQLLNGPLGFPALFQGLSSGNYTFAVEDNRGCRDTVSAGLLDPTAVVIAIDSTQDIACFGNETGEIFLSAQGGAGNYTFQADSNLFSSTGIFDLLGAGTYFVSVRDALGCTARDTLVLNQAPQLLIFIDSLKPILCSGKTDALLQVRATGGTGRHLFALNSTLFSTDSLFSPLGAGTYAILVQDSIGCQEDLTVVVTDPPVLSAAALTENISCFGFRDGSISVSGTGGKSPYLYSLNQATGVASSVFSGLDTGLYQVVVTDSLGCSFLVDSLQISQPAVLQILATGTDITCAGGADGTVLTQTTGGTPAYHWSWTNSDTTSGIGNLNAGDYRVVVRDAHDCTDTASVTLVQPEDLVLTLLSKKDAFCTFPNGDASLSLVGGTGPDFSIQWNSQPPQAGLQADSLLPGLYRVVATDAFGCTDTLTITIGDEPPAQAAFTTDPAAGIPVAVSNAAFRFLNQSTGALSFLWSFGDGQGVSELPEPNYGYTSPGVYPVILAAYNRYQDCPTFDTLLITIVPDGKIFIPNAFTPNGDGKNDRFLIVNEGLTYYQLFIFDRWGNTIFVTLDPQESWDGLDASRADVPEGVYTFLVSAELTTGDKIRRAGTITLIR